MDPEQEIQTAIRYHRAGRLQEARRLYENIFFKEYRKGTNLVLLSPDLAEVFSTDEAVNEALRSLIRLAEKSSGRASQSDAPPG